jgi:hypothetical protein
MFSNLRRQLFVGKNWRFFSSKHQPDLKESNMSCDTGRAGPGSLRV